MLQNRFRTFHELNRKSPRVAHHEELIPRGCRPQILRDRRTRSQHRLPRRLWILHRERDVQMQEVHVRIVRDARRGVVVDLHENLPRTIRDGLYGLVARNRYRVFGKYESCMLPDPKHRGKFLDQ